ERPWAEVGPEQWQAWYWFSYTSNCSCEVISRTFAVGLLVNEDFIWCGSSLNPWMCLYSGQEAKYNRHPTDQLCKVSCLPPIPRPPARSASSALRGISITMPAIIKQHCGYSTKPGCFCPSRRRI